MLIFQCEADGPCPGCRLNVKVRKSAEPKVTSTFDSVEGMACPNGSIVGPKPGVADSVSLRISTSNSLGYKDVDGPGTTIEEQLLSAVKRDKERKREPLRDLSCRAQRERKAKCLETPFLMSGPQSFHPNCMGLPSLPQQEGKQHFECKPRVSSSSLYFHSRHGDGEPVRQPEGSKSRSLTHYIGLHRLRFPAFHAHANNKAQWKQ